jgi:hypothetical protein
MYSDASENTIGRCAVKRISVVCLTVILLASSVGGAITSGSSETMVIRDFSGAVEPFAAPGQTFVVAGAIRVYDPGDDGVPTAIEKISLCLAPTSTLSSRYISGLRLYVDESFSGFFDRRESTLLGSKVRPKLDDCENPETFGRAGELLVLVPNRGAKLFFIVVDIASDAPDGASLALSFDATASDGLRGGPTISSGFSSEQGPPVFTDTLTIRATSGDLETDVVDETPALTARPGTSVVVQQFVIADPGSDGDTEDDGLATLVRSITVQAVLEDTTIDLSPSAGLIQRIRLFRESGRTGPGWQPGDELLGEVVRPDLAAGVTFGRDGRRLVRVGRNNIFGTGGVERFYIVVDLAPGGFAHTENRLRTQVTVAARDDGSEDGEESSGIETPMPVIATNAIIIEPAVGGARAIMEDISLLRAGKAVLRVESVPLPGLGSMMGTISFDPDILQVAASKQGSWRVRGLGNYRIDFVDVNNNSGTIEFLLTLKTGRKPLIGDGRVMEIEFITAEDVSPGDSSPLDVEIDQAADVNGNELVFDEVSGTARIKLIMGDVDGNGVVTYRDARLLARWLMGRAVLSPLQKKVADVNHSCPASTNWATLEPGDCVDETDVRWIKEAAAGLRTLSSSANFQVLGRGLTVLMLPSGGLELRAPSAERLSLQVFALSGQMVFSAESATGTLRFAGVSNRGQRLAKGVYLYVVTLYGRDGSVWRSEVRKLVVK